MMYHAIIVIVLAATVTSQRPDVDFDDETCGLPMVPTKGLIKNGFNSYPGEWPWHVAIFHRIANRAEFDYQCGGSLVHKYLVITAAHCVTLPSSQELKPSGDVIVKVGRFNISKQYEEQGREHEVDQIVTHRGYKPLTFSNDIAILKLKVPAILTPYVSPVCLWKRDDGKSLPEFHGNLGTVVGWGLTENDTLTSTLNKAQMPVVGMYDCLESDRPFFGPLLNARIYCAGFRNGTGVCNGDSGGGMYFKRERQWYLRGVVSFSGVVDSTTLCNLKQYVGFTDAAQYLKWIYENAPVSRNDDPILGHPNIRLINKVDCGKNDYEFEYQEEKKRMIQQYLWMAVVRNTFQDYNAVPCQGVLINKDYILTTDCRRIKWNLDVSVILGDYSINEHRDCGGTILDRPPYTDICADPVQTTKVDEYFKKDRLILARLSSPALIGLRNHINAICLPVSPEQRNHVYQKYILTGWMSDKKYDKLLQRDFVDLIDQKTCSEEIAQGNFTDKEERNITDAIICVRNPKNPNKEEPESCKTYQYGSAIQTIDEQTNQYVLHGIRIGLPKCFEPARLIAVAKYMEWILDHMKP